MGKMPPDNIDPARASRGEVDGENNLLAIRLVDGVITGVVAFSTFSYPCDCSLLNVLLFQSA